MNIQKRLVEWGTDHLNSNKYAILRAPEVVSETPWSTVIRFSTSKSEIFLKQTPSFLFLSLEPKIMEILAKQFPENVPTVLATNDDLHCFLMRGAGIPLRKALKAEFNADLLCQAIKQYSAIQRSTENKNAIDNFLKLGVPDWRLNKLPDLYNHFLINQVDFLRSEGITDKELQILQDLSPQFSSQCKLLASYGISETIGQHDFHDNNILIDEETKRLTFIDLGETAIIHPFLSLYTCLYQATIHHGIKEDKSDQTYQKLQAACFENWLGLSNKNEFSDLKELLEIFILVKRIWPFYTVLACYELMISVGLQAYKAHYANRSSKIAEFFRKYINSSQHPGNPEVCDI